MLEKSSPNKDLAQQRKEQFRRLVAENSTYPLATITYHGPSPHLASKIVVGILSAEGKDPVVREWTGDDISEDVAAAREIARFIEEYQVARVLTSEWVLSCPHQEGVDYQLGEDCPLCPEWQ
jgi:hypothetical protein